MFGNVTTCRSLLIAAMIVISSTLAGPAPAQTVGAIADSETITESEIQQRSRLTELTAGKTPTRAEMVAELRKEKLRIHEARKFGVEVPDSEVDEAYASIASRMRMTSEQFTERLAQAGVNADTLKRRIRSDIAWQRYQQWRRQDPLRRQQDPPPRGRDAG
jgi:peptidyl-prolyl cis-trans isomerase SurA